MEKRCGDSSITTFCEYFCENWIQKKSKWFEGAPPAVSVTNNEYEGVNEDIKDSYTFRESKSILGFNAYNS